MNVLFIYLCIAKGVYRNVLGREKKPLLVIIILELED